MAARPQSVCYPAAAQVCVNISQPPMCTVCNSASPYNAPPCCTSSTAQNTGAISQACSAFCQLSCNTLCVSLQAYCSIGKQVVTSHADVGAHPAITCVAFNQFIFRNWTADYWNALIDNIDTAETVGKTKTQGTGAAAVRAVADPCNNTHPANSLVVAPKYNQIKDKIIRFNTTYAAVNTGEVIKGTHAAALKTNYEAMKFNTNVCDICNAAAQKSGVCGCNCPCPCSCDCGCPCPCDCDCSCSCDCDCDCNCGCDCDCDCSCGCDCDCNCGCDCDCDCNCGCSCDCDCDCDCPLPYWP